MAGELEELRRELQKLRDRVEQMEGRERGTAARKREVAGSARRGATGGQAAGCSLLARPEEGSAWKGGWQGRKRLWLTGWARRPGADRRESHGLLPLICPHCGGECDWKGSRVSIRPTLLGSNRRRRSSRSITVVASAAIASCKGARPGRYPMRLALWTGHISGRIRSPWPRI